MELRARRDFPGINCSGSRGFDIPGSGAFYAAPLDGPILDGYTAERDLLRRKAEPATKMGAGFPLYAWSMLGFIVGRSRWCWPAARKA